MSTSTICEPQVDKDAILRHLEELLADRRFGAAERNASFLRYVVERTLEGKSGEIKETVIATDVYGRLENYDPKADSIVRVEASRLRQRLRAYYENEGRSATIRIQLPSGTYVPVFERIAVPCPPPDSIAEPQQSPPQTTPNARGEDTGRSLLLVAVAIGAAAAVIIVAMFTSVVTGASAGLQGDSDALVALNEGITLLHQDPHTAETENGPPTTLVRAIERLEFAVARDPKLARAWVSLAEAYDYIYPYVGRVPAEDARRAESAARTAIALDPNLPAAHHMLGLVQGFIKWDLQAAEASYKRALKFDPYNVYAQVEYADLLRETGRVQQAAEQIRVARAMQPSLPQLAAKDAEIQLDLGRVDAAITAAKSALQARKDFLRAHIALGAAYEKQGEVSQALERYEYVLGIDPTDRRALPAYGYLLARTGQTARAKEVAARLERMNSTVRNCAFQIAVVYAGLGEHETAMNWLERAWQTRQPHVPFAAIEYRFRSLHQSARFRELLANIGLKPVVTPVLRSPESPST